MLSPIIERVSLYSTNHGGIRFHDFNLVQTTLGAMIESRNLSPIPVEQGADIANFDQENNEITALRQVDENKIFGWYSHNGSQVPYDVRI